MYCIMIHATPDPGKDRDPEAEDAIGAYVNAWIDYADVEGAEVLARHYIADAGWVPGETEKVRILEREDCSDDNHSLACFDEASEYGKCMCYHLYASEEEEKEGDEEAV